VSNGVKVFNPNLPQHFAMWLQKHPAYLPSVSKMIDMGDGSMMILDADLDNDPEDTLYCVTDPTTGLTSNLPNKTTAIEEIASYEQRLCELMLGIGVQRNPDQEGVVEQAEIRLRDLE